MTYIVEALEGGIRDGYVRVTEYLDETGQRCGESRAARVVIQEFDRGCLVRDDVIELAPTGPRYYRLGNALVRHSGGTLADLESVRDGKWVDDPALFKYFCGAWGDQTEPLPLTEAEAREVAAGLDVELEAPAQREDVPSPDRKLRELFPEQELEDLVMLVQPKRPPRP